MAIKEKKGLGLLGKVILFSLIPFYVIAGVLVYLYKNDLKEVITQKYIEEALLSASVIQGRISPADLLQRPAEANRLIQEMIQNNPNFIKIAIYAKVNGAAKVIASTESEEIGQTARPEAAEPLSTGESAFNEHLEGGQLLLETVAPYLDEGRTVAAIGIYTSATPRDTLVAYLFQRVLWIALGGSALVLIAVFYVVYRVLLAPLRLLKEGSDALARGELGYRLPLRGRDEMSNLMKGFNVMAAALQASQARLKRLVESNILGIIVADTKGNITEANDVFLEMIGYTREELLSGKVRWDQMTPPEWRHWDEGAIEQLKQRGVTIPWEKEYIRKDGSRVPILVGAALLEPSTGNCICFVLDISERKRLQQQLVQSEKLAGLGTIAMGLAHEINNPLFAIMGTAETILDEEDPKLIREYTRDIIQSSRSAADIIKSLIMYSRFTEAGKTELIDVNKKLDEALKISRHSAQWDGIEVITEYRADKKIVISSGELQQVFVNILNNAVQAMQGKGKLLLSTRTDQEGVVIRISDTGPGIPKEHIGKVFDPFFTTKDPDKGTGLGLNIAYRIITKYKGMISVESEEGKGATFVITFPIGE